MLRPVMVFVSEEIGLAKERDVVKSQPPLFTTMEMSPYLDLAANKAETEELFHWPAPPYFEFIRGGGRQGPEECLLIFKDGTKAAGRLVDFRPDEALDRAADKAVMPRNLVNLSPCDRT